MNLRHYKQRTISIMLKSDSRFWNSIPSALALDLGEGHKQIDAAFAAAFDEVAQPVLQFVDTFPNKEELVSVRRKKDGEVLFTDIPRSEADEHIATAKRQKKAALEWFNEFTDL